MCVCVVDAVMVLSVVARAGSISYIFSIDKREHCGMLADTLKIIIPSYWAKAQNASL